MRVRSRLPIGRFLTRAAECRAGPRSFAPAIQSKFMRGGGGARDLQLYLLCSVVNQVSESFVPAIHSKLMPGGSEKLATLFVMVIVSNSDLD